MKLSPRSFRVFWDLHAWAGVLASLLVYVMFLAGVPTLFFHELSIWQDPALIADAPAAPSKVGPLFERVVREQSLLGSPRLFIDLRDTPVGVSFTDQRGGDHTRLVTPGSGELARERSGLAQFLYELHFLYVVPGGMYVAGLLALALALALVSGVLIHLKDLPAQLLRFRPTLSLRWSASDAHKVLGIFGLPFQVLFAWSGAALCLGWLVIQPVFTAVVFGGDEQAAEVARGHSTVQAVATRRSAPLPDVDVLAARAEKVIPGFRLGWIEVQHVGDEGSTVDLGGSVEGVTFGRGRIAFRARDAEVLSVQDPRRQPAIARFESWLFGLHLAAFGGLALDLLYALLALATCAVLVTGNIVWLERRDPERAHPGNRFLERLTIGTAVGLPFAVSSLFVANRLLPLEWASRLTLERGAFLASWVLALVLAFLPRLAPRAATVLLLDAAALGFGFVPVFDLVVRPSTLSSSLARGVDIGLLGTALACALTARILRRAQRTAKARSTPRGARRIGAAG